MAWSLATLICRNHPWWHAQDHHHYRVSHSLPFVKTLSHYHCMVTHGPHLVNANNKSTCATTLAGHVQQRVPHDNKEIIPRVVQHMYNIGYTCEKIVSFLTHRQRLNNKLTATINILKYQLSYEDSHQHDKSWLNMIHKCPLSFPLPLKKRASEQAFHHCRSREDSLSERGCGTKRQGMQKLHHAP